VHTNGLVLRAEECWRLCGVGDRVAALLKLTKMDVVLSVDPDAGASLAAVAFDLVRLLPGEIVNQHHIGAPAQLQHCQQVPRGRPGKSSQILGRRLINKCGGEPSIGWYCRGLPPLETTLRTMAFPSGLKLIMPSTLISSVSRCKTCPVLISVMSAVKWSSLASDSTEANFASRDMKKKAAIGQTL